MDGMTQVYRKDTGEKVYVPEHWMDHPTLSLPFSKTPSQKAKDAEKQAKADAEAALAAINADAATSNPEGK